MPISNEKLWNSYVERNTDQHGEACVKVAQKVMEIIDGLKPDENFVASEIIHKAGKESKVVGITGFMAGCVAAIVTACHSRGDDFIKSLKEEYAENGR